LPAEWDVGSRPLVGFDARPRSTSEHGKAGMCYRRSSLHSKAGSRIHTHGMSSLYFRSSTVLPYVIVSSFDARRREEGTKAHEHGPIINEKLWLAPRENDL
jgi:hypothetical protein